jgi:hypothetical protein
MGMKSQYSTLRRSAPAMCAVVLNVFLYSGAAVFAQHAFASLKHREARSQQDEQLDRFGGLAIPVAEPAGYFRVQKIGNRTLFLTPDGHPFWMRSVYAVDWLDGGAESAEALKLKYGGNPNLFAQHAVRKLRSWGFNTLGEYTSAYVYPLPTYYRPRGNSQQMPFIRLLNVSWYGALDEGHLAPAPFKTLLAGAVDPQVYKGWSGHVPDVFDPNFAIYARNSAADLKTANRQTIFTEKTATGGLPHPSLVKTPWLIGTEPDDADNLFGFGPGSQDPGSDGAIHPHIGWVIAVTKTAQSENMAVGAVFGDRRTITYTDPIVYAKRAWRSFLVEKYHTINALNAAWGSRYTTFDSDGDWPMGRGLMDESGRNPWIGSDALKLSTASPKVIADLDAFLGVYADQYFRIVTQAIRAATPNQLVLSPVLDSHGGMSRPQVLKAAGKYCDVIQVNFDPQRPDLLVKTYQVTGKPMFSWLGLKANPDSALRDSGNTEPGLATQADRAALYAKEVVSLFSLKVSDGTYPVVGMDWWEYMDKLGEKSNWGLVTAKDNAYDGKEDVAASSTDSWGYATGHEMGDFGDFLTGAKDANLAIDRQLLEEMRSQRVSRVTQGTGTESKR